MLNFEQNGKQCSMKFLDTEVKKPLGAVSAMEDAGNTVVFSKKWGVTLRMMRQVRGFPWKESEWDVCHGSECNRRKREEHTEE